MGRDLVVLGIAFLLAGLFARAARGIGLPTIPVFMAAGILVGPNTPGPVLFRDPDELKLLATFGLIFLLFYLGLEFSLGDITAGGRRLLLSAGVYLVTNVGAGLALGFTIGWGTPEAFVIAGATGISSSAIVTKLLIELRRLANPETRLILGIIVIEDLFLALYLAALAPLLGDADTPRDAVVLFGGAFAFLVALFLVARFGGQIVSRLIDARDDELLTLGFVGLALLVAGIAYQPGVSDAIGAFMAGVLLAGTAVARRVERLVMPLRDAFGALFFFSFGLAIDPQDFGSVVVPAAAAVTMSLALAMVAGATAARINGLDRVGAANIAFSVLARGEFALILVTLAIAAGLDARLVPFVGIYVLTLATASPILAAYAPRIAEVIPPRWFPTRDERAGSTASG